MLSQEGMLSDKTGYNKFIGELKVLYAQYWPEDAGVLMERLRLSCCSSNLTLPTRVHMGLQKEQRLGWKKHLDELMELLVAFNSIPIASAQ